MCKEFASLSSILIFLSSRSHVIKLFEYLKINEIKFVTVIYQ